MSTKSANDEVRIKSFVDSESGSFQIGSSLCSNKLAQQLSIFKGETISKLISYQIASPIFNLYLHSAKVHLTTKKGHQQTRRAVS
jgi:hypothetical protein